MAVDGDRLHVYTHVTSARTSRIRKHEGARRARGDARGTLVRTVPGASRRARGPSWHRWSAVLTVALIGLLACRRATPPERIVLIVVDTLRQDHVSPYASDVETPNIARLAERGQVFQNAYASFHQTTMSMAALFTGEMPSLESPEPGRSLPWSPSSWCGMARFQGSGAGETCLPPRLSTLAERLRAADYRTLAVVGNSLLFRPYGYDQGFEVWEEVGERSGDPRRDAASRSASRVNARARIVLDDRTSDRFFLYVHYMDVHDWVLVRRPYLEGVRRVDAAVGQLLGRLEATGLLEGSVVLLVADHGEMLGAQHLDFDTSRHFGNPSFEPVLRIPLLVAPPVFDDPARTIRTQDLGGMILELAGLAPDHPPGPLVGNELYLSELRYRTYRSGPWKSIWPRNGDGVWLFDLAADPGELESVARDHPRILEQHRRRMEEIAAGVRASAPEADLSRDDLERLRSLGYAH